MLWCTKKHSLVLSRYTHVHNIYARWLSFGMNYVVEFAGSARRPIFPNKPDIHVFLPEKIHLMISNRVDRDFRKAAMPQTSSLVGCIKGRMEERAAMTFFGFWSTPGRLG